MAYENVRLVLPGLRANSTGLATKQYNFGKLATTAGQVVISAALNTTTVATTIVGVINNAPGAYDEVEFVVSGVAKVKAASTALAIGDWVSVNSTGQALKTTTDNRGVVGRALEASSAANDIISVLLCAPGGKRY